MMMNGERLLPISDVSWRLIFFPHWIGNLAANAWLLLAVSRLVHGIQYRVRVN